VTDRGRAVEGANPDGSGGASTHAVQAEFARTGRREVRSFAPFDQFAMLVIVERSAVRLSGGRQRGVGATTIEGSGARTMRGRDLPLTEHHLIQLAAHRPADG
jgi:hypothetical protein